MVLEPNAVQVEQVRADAYATVVTAQSTRIAILERTPAADEQVLMEPLSERELDVLRLLGTDLDGPEIARHLVVSLSTLRTHTRNIYSKLGVNNRRAAVRRAEALHLTSWRTRTGNLSSRGAHRERGLPTRNSYLAESSYQSSHLMRPAHHIPPYCVTKPTNAGAP